MPKQPKQCAARCPGDTITGDYQCARNARAGSRYCYYHDPALAEERRKRTTQQAADRRLRKAEGATDAP